MVLIRLCLILFSCFLTCFCYNTGGNESFLVPESLKLLCPLTDFCTDTPTLYNISDGFVPCCQTCSCRPDCMLTHNCCQDRFASSEFVDYTSCEYPGVTRVESYLSYDTYYRMIDKCPDITLDCRNLETAPWGNVYPVSSPSSKKTFINNHCAICNNVTDGIFWHVSFFCPLFSNKGTFSIDAFIQGSRECSVKFYPPTMDGLRPEQCLKNIIRECTESFIPQHNEDVLCKYFNATYVAPLASGQGSNIAYGNIYCAICNIDGTTHIEDECEVADEMSSMKGSDFKTMISLLDDKVVNEILDRYQSTASSPAELKKYVACGLDVDSTETACRPLLCPEGQIRLDGSECQYFSAEWTTGRMSMLIKLTYEPQSDLVPMQCLLQEIKDAANKQIRLLLRNMSGFSYVLFFKESSDLAYAESFVVKLSYMVPGKGTFNPKIIFETILNSLHNTWKLYACGKIFLFRGFNNKYISYTSGFPCHAMNSLVPTWLALEKIGEQTCTLQNKFKLFPIRFGELINMANDALWLTNTFFCNQILLYDHEFEDLGEQIYVVKTGLYLGDAEFRRTRSVDGRKAVNVCVDQFLRSSSFRISNFPNSPVFYIVLLLFK